MSSNINNSNSSLPSIQKNPPSSLPAKPSKTSASIENIPVKRTNIPTASSSVEVHPSEGSTVMVESSSGSLSLENAEQMCRVRNVAERLFDLDQSSEIDSRKFSLIKEFETTLVDNGTDTLTEPDVEPSSQVMNFVHQLIKDTDNSIEKVLKKLGATDEMVQYAIVNKLDIAKLIGKAVTLTRAAHNYNALSKQLATVASGSPEAKSIESRMNTIAVRALSAALLLPSLAKLVVPSAGPQYTIISFFTSYTAESAGDLLLSDPYPGMSARYKAVAVASNALGTLAYGALTYSLLLQVKEDPDSALSKGLSGLATASTLAFGTQVAYDVILMAKPPVTAIGRTAERAARIAAPVIRNVGLVAGINLLQLGVALTGRFAEVFSFFEGR